MAMISCFECGGNVSTAAKSCPHCGAKARAFKKRPSRFSFVWVGFGVLIVLSLSLPKVEREKTNNEIINSTTSKEANTTYSPNDILELEGIRVPVVGICQAGIATIMSRPIQTVSATVRNNYVYVYYERDSDGSMWDYKCKVVGDKIVWGAPEGRWRTQAEDGVVRFKVVDEDLVITEEMDGGPVMSQSYSLVPQ